MKKILKHYWPEVKKHKRALCLMIFGMLLAVFFETLIPFYVRNFINLLSKGPSTEAYTQILGILKFLALSYAGIWLAWRINEFAATRFESSVMRELDAKSFECFERQCLRFFEERFTGSLVRKAGRFISAFEAITDIVYFQFLRHFLTIAVVFTIFFLEKPLFGALFSAWAAIFLIGNFYFATWKMKYDALVSKADSATGAFLSDSLGNQLTVKAFAQEKSELSKFRRILDDRFRKIRKSWTLSNYSNLVQAVFMLGFELLLFYFAARWWREGTFTVGDFVFFQIYLLGLFEGLWQFGRQIQMMYENMARASEMVEILENPVPIQDAPDAKKLVVTQGEIEFRNLSFSYQNADQELLAPPVIALSLRGAAEGSDEAISSHTLSLREALSEPIRMTQGKLRESKGDEAISMRALQSDLCHIFRKFSLRIKGGEKVALVGPSGAGKSTIVKLLFRFFDPDSGRIFIDGQNITKVTQESLRRNIALVPQNPELFHRTIAENIMFGKPHATREEIREAAKKAHADDFIEKLPRKYETLVGERGVKLSGGEKQRVAIARAFLENAPILILDEATSSLDSLTEKKIQDALEHLMKGRTTIVIAHRLSTIRKMDRIIVIKDGAIAEDGAHNDLLAQNGLYAELWKHQGGSVIARREGVKRPSDEAIS